MDVDDVDDVDRRALRNEPSESPCSSNMNFAEVGIPNEKKPEKPENLDEKPMQTLEAQTENVKQDTKPKHAEKGAASDPYDEAALQKIWEITDNGNDTRGRNAAQKLDSKSKEAWKNHPENPNENVNKRVQLL